jgi:hypothetical protein
MGFISETPLRDRVASLNDTNQHMPPVHLGEVGLF